MNTSNSPPSSVVGNSSFNIGPYHVISQDPSVLSGLDANVVASNLETLIRVWKRVEQATGFRWKCTSFLRQSPSHSRGHAIDLAPDFAPASFRLYSGNVMSDPVMYKRIGLLRRLGTLRSKSFFKFGDVGIWVEPDHLHIQLMARDPDSQFRTRIVQWGVRKPCYKDTDARRDLPLFED